MDPTREIMNGFSYGDITASFYMSESYKEKQFFERWIETCYLIQILGQCNIMMTM